MAQYQNRKDNHVIPYKELERALKAAPPARVYMLYGPEDYLRDSYLSILREKCVPDGVESFNYRRINGPSVDMKALSEAIEALPFMGDSTLLEVRDFDINKTSDYDGKVFAELLADVPDWATVAFVFSPEYQPDGRIGPVKALKKYGVELQFTAQDQSMVSRWIVKHFQEYNKACSPSVADHLQMVSGNTMHLLRDEIIKIAGAVKAETITEEDIDRLATKTLQTRIFDMTDMLGRRKYDEALFKLSELLSDRDQKTELIMYMISETMRQLYCAKISPAGAAGKEYMLECFPELSGRQFVIGKMTELAKSFSAARLVRAVELCADCEFAMRNGGNTGDAEHIKELILRLALDTNDV